MAKVNVIGPPPDEHTPGKAARREAQKARATRLAAALKSNLRRRKTQARERAADAAEAGHPAGLAGDQSTSSVLSSPADESAPRQEASHESAGITGDKPCV
jgi:hypothetical protein